MNTFQSLYNAARSGIGTTFGNLWRNLCAQGKTSEVSINDWDRCAQFTGDDMERRFGGFHWPMFMFRDGSVLALLTPNGERAVVARTMVGMMLLVEEERGYRKFATGCFKYVENPLNVLEHMAAHQDDGDVEISEEWANLYLLPRLPEYTNAGFRRDVLLAATANASTGHHMVPTYAPVLLAHMRKGEAVSKPFWDKFIGNRADEIYSYIVE